MAKCVCGGSISEIFSFHLFQTLSFLIQAAVESCEPRDAFIGGYMAIWVIMPDEGQSGGNVYNYGEGAPKYKNV